MIPKKYQEKVAQNQPHWTIRQNNTSPILQYFDERNLSPQGIKILDAGCAQGRDTHLLSKSGFQAEGIDFDQNYISNAKKDYPHLKFILGDIEQLPYQNNSFDIVHCVNTLFYTDVKKSLSELGRILKPNGLAFITLDEKINDLDQNKDIHCLDVFETLKSTNFDILKQKYQTRIDLQPFRHQHFFYYLILKKPIPLGSKRGGE